MDTWNVSVSGGKIVPNKSNCEQCIKWTRTQFSIWLYLAMFSELENCKDESSAFRDKIKYWRDFAQMKNI